MKGILIKIQFIMLDGLTKEMCVALWQSGYIRLGVNQAGCVLRFI